MPYDRGTLHSIYHIREFNVHKLSLLSSPAIFLSHDWPQSIEHYSNLPGLLARKRFLKPDIDAGQLGSPPLMMLMSLLRTLKPAWWFAAHLHTKYEVVVIHDEGLVDVRGENPDEIVIDDEELGEAGPPASTSSIAHPNTDEITINDKDIGHAPRLNPDEIALDDEEADVAAPPLPPPPHVPQWETRFLALDKCLSYRDFLKLTFDAEWLAITRVFDPFFSTTVTQQPFPGKDMRGGWFVGSWNRCMNM